MRKLSWKNTRGAAEPYKHETDYGTRYQRSNFLNDSSYLQKLEEIKKKTDIFIRYGRAADIAKRSGWDWDLIYLETDKKRGPCWAPSKKLLKKLYDDEKNRVNTLKLEALQSEGLVKASLRQPPRKAEPLKKN